jgi:hypothetical protein
MQLKSIAASGEASDRALTKRALRESVRVRLLETGGTVKLTARALGLSNGRVRSFRDEFGIAPLAADPWWERASVTARRRLAVPTTGELDQGRAWLLATGGDVRRTAMATGLTFVVVKTLRDELGLGRHSPYSNYFRNKDRRDSKFWSQVDKTSSSSGCWLWGGLVNDAGYGQVFGTSAHRWAFEAKHGPLNGRHLHHVCKNPRCVNPAHLLPVAGPTEHARLEKLEKEFAEYLQGEQGQAELAALRRTSVAA